MNAVRDAQEWLDMDSDSIGFDDSIYHAETLVILLVDVVRQVEAAVEPHLGFQASERGALARRVARITGRWESGHGLAADNLLLDGAL